MRVDLHGFEICAAHANGGSRGLHAHIAWLRFCSIARALAVGPEVLLMDEPCSALDPIATAKIEELMFRLRERLSVVIVTHNMQQAARASDRTAFLWMGELIEEGETEAIFTTPKKSMTEDYITGRFG